MNTKELILNQFEACYNRDTWFVSLKTALDGVSAEQASYKSESSTHSIMEIAHHLYFYNLLELNRFKDIADNVSVKDNKTTFTDAREMSWELLVNKLFTTMKDWIYEMKRCDEEYIKRYSESLTYINLHNAYHIGQILQIRKNQGIWNENKGINYTI
ncbi:DinB family protein [Gracilibacillus salitolerans]|uniref:DinB family protein n=1 Tax=Gracilibacillus salitolerans TaxID=2663022 RepID=A0A5Q2THJ7_9BACI|nr:DinB family protein [Gracilibacillus salitolerans]QGH32878.1 DinB family protein [Gracilibacillus salitolerans]